MDRKLILYYKRKLYGGRSTAARFIDFIVLRVVVLFVIFLTLLFFSRSITVSLLVSVFITLAVSFALALFRQRRIRHFIEKDMARIKRKCLLEELTMLDAAGFEEYITRLFEGLTEIKPLEDGFMATKEGVLYYVIHNHPSSVCDIDIALKIYRQLRNTDSVVVTLGDFNEAARTFFAGQKIKLVSGKMILKAAAQKDMLPDEDTAQQKAHYEMCETIVTIDKLKGTAFSKSKIKAYILCGLIITCWPLVAGFRIYYPFIAVFCFVMAAITYRKSKTHEESHGIGIT